jgi:hypothetical protein
MPNSSFIRVVSNSPSLSSILTDSAIRAGLTPPSTYPDSRLYVSHRDIPEKKFGERKRIAPLRVKATHPHEEKPGSMNKMYSFSVWGMSPFI